MSSGVTEAAVQVSPQQLRAFHLSGKGLEYAAPHGPLRPALLDHLPQLPRLESEFPVYLAPGSLPRPLNDVFQTLPAEHIPLLTRAFHDAARGFDRAPIGQVMQTVGKLHKPLPPEKELAAGAWIVPFTARATPILYASVLEAARAKARAHFVASLKSSRDRLAELLLLDDSHAPEATSAGSVSASLGTAGAFFRPGVLAEAFDRPVAAVHRMPPDRRRRCEQTLATLEKALVKATTGPTLYFFSGAEGPIAVGEVCRTPDSFADALAFCERQLDEFAVTLRALRTARLEAQSAYEPSLHDELLQRLGWEAADADELAALPAIVILESVERLADTSLTNFGRVLRSGLPIQILVEASGFSAAALHGFVPDFGSLSIAHREAFVLQSSLARLDHLLPGLSEMAGSLRTAVAIVSVPPQASDPDAAWIETSLLTLSRAFPLFRYNPDLAETWEGRFALLTDPSQSFDAPVSLPSTGGVDVLTAIHALAISPQFNSQFRLLPKPAWHSEQMELHKYLEKFAQRPPLAVPFLWVLDGGDNLQRAVVSRELVNLCRERARSWKIYEELAAVHATKNAPPAEPADQTDARKQGALQAIHRIVSMLTGAPTEPRTEIPEPPAPVAAPADVQSEPPPEETSEEPFIESFLCTSCGDCMKINPRMFGYDANKQACIADAGAGTFAELVKAAIGCPAGCIHPGTPRPGDKTATPQLIAKARNFS